MSALKDSLQQAYDQVDVVLSEVTDLEEQGWIICQLINDWSDEKKGIDQESATSLKEYIKDSILYPKPTLENYDGRSFPVDEEFLANNPSLATALEKLKSTFSLLDAYPNIRRVFFIHLIDLLSESGEFDHKVKEELKRYYFDILSDPNAQID